MFGRNVGTFKKFSLPSKAKKSAYRFGEPRGLSLSPNFQASPAVAKAVKMIEESVFMVDGKAVINYSTAPHCVLAKLIILAQQLGLSKNVKSLASLKKAKIGSYAGRSGSGEKLLVNFNEFVDNFITPIARAAATNNMASGVVINWLQDLITFSQAVGVPGHGLELDAPDIALLSVGYEEANKKYPGQIEDSASMLSQYGNLHMGYINYTKAVKKGTIRASATRTVRTRIAGIQWTEIKSGALLNAYNKNVLSFPDPKQQQHFVKAVKKAVGYAILNDIDTFTSNLGAVVIKSAQGDTLKSKVGNAFLVSCIFNFLGKGFKNLTITNFGQTKNIKGNPVKLSKGIALIPAGTVDIVNALTGSGKLVRLSSKTVSGKMILLQIVKNMIEIMKADPRSLENMSNANTTEVREYLESVYNGVVSNAPGARESFNVLAKGIVFYISLEGSFGLMVDQAMKDPSFGRSETTSLQRGLRKRSYRPYSGSSMVSISDINALAQGTVRGSNVSGYLDEDPEVGGWGATKWSIAGNKSTGRFQKKGVGQFRRPRNF